MIVIQSILKKIRNNKPKIKWQKVEIKRKRDRERNNKKGYNNIFTIQHKTLRDIKQG